MRRDDATNTTFGLGELAELVDGEVLGDAATRISGIRPFDQARKGDITFATKPELLKRLASCRAEAVIVGLDFRSEEKPLLRSSHPKLSFAKILARFHEEPFEATGVSPLASIGESCEISERVTIEPFARIGNRVVIGDEVSIGSGTVIGDRCRIGRGSRIFPNVSVYSNTLIGERVRIHSGTVIGADGFGYVHDGTKQVKLLQTGRVELRDEVEIGANSCVDRATFGATVLERCVKLDNHVHIAHNCHIGENTVIVGCVGISGSVRIGRNCILAGQAGVIDHINIGDNVTVMVKTAVTKDIPSGSTVSGQPSRNHAEELRIQAVLRKLPQVYKEWRQLKSKL